MKIFIFLYFSVFLQKGNIRAWWCVVPPALLFVIFFQLVEDYWWMIIYIWIIYWYFMIWPIKTGFHYVTALSDISISLNTWFDCEELEIIDSIRSFPIPFEESWRPDEFLPALILYIKFILLEFYSGRNTSSLPVSNFIHEEFIQSRYSQMIKRSILPLHWPLDSTFRCTNDDSFLDGSFTLKFQKRAEELVALFNKLPYGVREIVLGNFIEEIIDFFIGSDAVLPFLFNCFPLEH